MILKKKNLQASSSFCSLMVENEAINPSPTSYLVFCRHLCPPSMSWILDFLSPRWSFFAASPLASLLRRLPSGAHASSILGFWSEDLRMLSSHKHPVSILALKNNARSVSWKRMLVSRREEYHAYTCPEKTNFLMHERVRTQFGPVPNYPHTPLKVKWATLSTTYPPKLLGKFSSVPFSQRRINFKLRCQRSGWRRWREGMGWWDGGQGCKCMASDWGQIDHYISCRRKFLIPLKISLSCSSFRRNLAQSS